MGKSDRAIWTYAGVAVFVIIGVACTVMIIAQLPMWGEKKAEWVGALGAVAAFAGTIWVATSQRRGDDTKALNLATIAAAGLWDRVEDALISTGKVDFFLNHETTRIGAAAQSLSREHLEAQRMWTADELLPLACLPDHVASRLQRVVSRRERMLACLRALEKERSDARRKEREGDLRDDAGMNLRDLKASSDEMFRLLGPIFEKKDGATGLAEAERTLARAAAPAATAG